MKSFVIAAMAAASLLVGGVAHASADKANAAGCMKCHDVDKKKMASSFKDIAAKNKSCRRAAAIPNPPPAKPTSRP